ncbi:MAG: hypothetical protein HY735_18175 [Verrucomicrobia bacterium]|nr:hypothetical protein [Verrucomicrobiota bacterium]
MLRHRDSSPSLASRRDLLKQVAGAGVIAALGPLAGCANLSTEKRQLIQRENAKTGTTDWLLTNTRVDPNTKYRCPWIEGYCSRNSVRPGESIDFMVSTNPPSSFAIDLYRLGYYGGKGGRHVAKLGPFDGKAQTDPPIGPERVRECLWEPAVKFTIPSNWLSGVYLGKLTEEKEKLQSYVIFIVRDDRTCDFLFQCSDTTWAAYNRWPDYFSLYDDGTPPHNWFVGPGVRAGWDRPYGKYRQIFDAPLSQGSGEFLLWEFPLACWMEKEGYDVSYISNVDTHADRVGLLRARSFLSVGHDEYWSLNMFNNVKAAVEAGVNAAFLSGNSCDGLVHFYANRAGTPNRSISRLGKFGPFEDELKRFGNRWRRHGPNPATLMGARSTSPYNGTADWTCAKEDHWLFEGTGMKNGDSIKGLVGWEHHGLPADIPGLEVLARGPVFSRGKPQNVEYTATIYPGQKGNWVFNAATIWWSDGLSEPPGYLRPSAHGGTPPGPDPRVRRITQNLFQRFLASGRDPHQVIRRTSQ